MTKTVLLGDIAYITKLAGYEFTKYIKYDDEGEVIALRALNLSNGQLDLSNIKRIPKEVSDKLPRSKLRKGDILLSYTGTVGNYAYVNKDNTYHLAPNVCLVRANESCLPIFLYYLIGSPIFKNRLVENSHGSTQVTVPMKNIRNISLQIPNIDTQEKIAKFLVVIDEKIELNRRTNETLEQMGQALFRHYFIDNPKAVMWEEKSLDDIADFLNGLAMQKYPFVIGKPSLPVIKIREMSSGITSITDLAAADISTQYIVNNGDLLFSWSGTLLVKFWSGGKGALNQHLFKVTSKDYPEWLYYYWTKHHLNDFIQTAKSKATTMGHIQRGHLKDAKVRVPEEVLMSEIGRQIQPLIDRYKINSEEIQTLTTLRDSLLPRLISGKLVL
ncbi:MAG: restriction endonuclease subunit S [Candidatus Saccharibacteria bacterium]